MTRDHSAALERKKKNDIFYNIIFLSTQRRFHSPTVFCIVKFYDVVKRIKKKNLAKFLSLFFTVHAVTRIHAGSGRGRSYRKKWVVEDLAPSARRPLRPDVPKIRMLMASAGALLKGTRRKPRSTTNYFASVDFLFIYSFFFFFSRCDNGGVFFFFFYVIIIIIILS